MKRRSFVQRALGDLGLILACLPKIKITRFRYYKSPLRRPTFKQSNGIVAIKTDQGIAGIGEGGSKDTVERLAGLLISEDPFRIEHLWQFMYCAYFYPPGREKMPGSI